MRGLVSVVERFSRLSSLISIPYLMKKIWVLPLDIDVTALQGTCSTIAASDSSGCNQKVNT